MSSRTACASLLIAVFAVCGCEPQAPKPSPPKAAATTPAVSAATATISEEQPLEPDLAAEEAAPANEEKITVQAMSWAEVESLIQQQKGKVVVVDVWSTSCEPCLREFPHLVELQKQYPEQVVCIGLNCDYTGIKKKPAESYREKVTGVLQKMHANLLNVLCTMPSDDLFAALKIDSIPAVFVYNRAGERVHTFDNRTPAGEGEGISYEKQINPAVAALVGK